MAWLNATPKPSPRSRRAKHEAEEPRLSRIDQQKAAGATPAMPPCPLPHLITRWVEIGLSEAAGMGVGPLSWASINEWQRATSVELSPWEARLIRHLSIEYLAAGRKAESETCPPFWRAEITSRDREIEDTQLRSVLG